VLHRDNLGSQQVIRPGQLNLMTAGHGVALSEEGTGRHTGELHDVQLWVAQPEATRHGPPAFGHHLDLLDVRLAGAEATVLVGTFAGQVTPARADSPLLGLDVVLRRGAAELPLEPSFEHALFVCEGAVSVEQREVPVGYLVYLGPGRDRLVLTPERAARVLLLGGTPFAEPVLMWWNFVAREAVEIEAVTREWNAAAPRFGTVASPLDRIPAPAVPPGLRR
jgi:redox-sensitive bicupin YhaK (pirin superfamily)